jgi:hypothetical protein
LDSEERERGDSCRGLERLDQICVTGRQPVKHCKNELIVGLFDAGNGELVFEIGDPIHVQGHGLVRPEAEV